MSKTVRKKNQLPLCGKNDGEREAFQNKVQNPVLFMMISTGVTLFVPYVYG